MREKPANCESIKQKICNKSNMTKIKIKKTTNKKRVLSVFLLNVLIRSAD